ncbi:MAG: hypothetical protein U0R64_09335 [Candidatus Nanopelagicales bacterium]
MWTSDGAAGTSAENSNWPAQAAIPLPGRDLLSRAVRPRRTGRLLGLWRVIVAGAVGLPGHRAPLAFLLWQRMDARRFRSMARELHDVP